MNETTISEVKSDAETSIADLIMRELVRTAENLRALDPPEGITGSPSRRIYEETRLAVLLPLWAEVKRHVQPDVIAAVNNAVLQRGQLPPA